MGNFNPLAYPICLTQPARLPDDPATPNWAEHIPFALFLIASTRPRLLVELGTHTGVSYCAFCQAVQELALDTRCYAIDTWQGDAQSGFYGPEVLADLRLHHDTRYGTFSQLVQRTFDNAVEGFADGSIDLLHIDGRHTYDTVKHDFETWYPKLSETAIVLFHDTNVRENSYGVWRLWQELAAERPHFEFLHGNGLGILVAAMFPSVGVRQLIETPRAEVPLMREFFQQLGHRLTMQHQRDRLARELEMKEERVQQLVDSAAVQEQRVKHLVEQGEEREKKRLQDVDDANQQLAQYTAAIARLQAQLARRVRAVEALIVQVKDKDQHIHNLGAIIVEREQRVQQLNAVVGSNQQVKQRLQDIESRASWQLLYKLWQVQMRLAAPATPRGKAWLALTRRARQVLPRRLIGGERAIGAVEMPPANGDPPVPVTIISGQDAESYDAWLIRNEPSEAALQSQHVEAAQLAYQPLLSIITPVYDPPEEVLQETIASVQAQTYPNWEFCLVEGGSTNPEIRVLLDRAAMQEPRIRVSYLAENLGIAGNSNAAAALASGEFLVLLDHDDTLAPHMLFEVANALNGRPEADLIYFDEDKLSEFGEQRSEPFFKPDWSPEMLLSANYLMHSVIRRELFMAVGGFASDTDGAQDWDLALRCTERSTAIVHIPKILYHWRQMAGSTAATYEAKPYVFDNQLRIVAEHLRHQGIAEARARFVGPGVLQAIWPTQNSTVSIIIPTKEKIGLLRPCLNSLLQLTAYVDYEVILVDTGSQQAETLAYYAELRDDPRVRILDYAQPFNYSAANNFGAAQASGDLLLFLNNDIEILHPDWLEELVRWAERPDIGVVGTKLLYPDGRIQHAGVIIGMEGHASHVFWGVHEQYGGPFGSSEWYRDYMAVTGACMMMRRTLFDEVGRFDEEYELAFSDIELCLRTIGAGYRNVYTPFARLRHHEGGSRGHYIPVDDMLRAYDHMYALVAQGDPFFNQNLSYTSRIPQLSRADEQTREARLRRLCGIQ
jgi:GT2 family glycosyltransferase